MKNFLGIMKMSQCLFDEKWCYKTPNSETRRTSAHSSPKLLQAYFWASDPLCFEYIDAKVESHDFSGSM